jgi:hypothetical protein
MKCSIHAVFYFPPVKDGPYKTSLQVTFSVTWANTYFRYLILLKALPIANLNAFRPGLKTKPGNQNSVTF